MGNDSYFPLQDAWPIKVLGDVMDCLDSRRIPLKESDRDNRRGVIPYYGASGVIDWIDEHIYDEPLLLVSEDGANLDSRSLPIAYSVDGKCWVNNHAHVLRVKEGSRFFFQCYLNNTSLKDYLSGTTRPKLTQALLLQIPLPFPPLAEQQAIAQVLRTVQRAKEATQKVIAAARQLKQSLMRHLFTYGPVPVDHADQVPLKDTEVGAIPEHWQVVRLGDGARVGNGSTPKRANERYWQNGSIPWLTSGKVYEQVIRQADEFVTETAREECHLPLVKKGSVVVAITGQGKTLGHAAILDLDTCVSQHLAYIQFNRSDVLPEFVLAFLQRQYAHFRQVSSAGGSTKGALTCAFLKSYPLPLPSVEEQREVAHALRAVDRKIKLEVARGQALDSLFKSLLHHLMTGTVRVNSIDLPAAAEGAPCL